MKNVLVIVVGLLVVIGCADSSKQKPNPHKMELEYLDQNYRVYTLEGCEYIVVGNGTGRWGSHKGNCKNPIHYSK
jgi:CO dehydrogenase/acetyl-CoA synthase alpha subunit